MTEDRQKHWDSLIARSSRSPYYQLLGMSVLEIGEGLARVKMPVETKLHHGRGIVHGGVIASIADGAAAFTVYSVLEPGIVTNTVELKINYLRPVSKGTLIAEGRIVQMGKRIAVVDLEVRLDDGKLVAKGLATMMIG